MINDKSNIHRQFFTAFMSILFLFGLTVNNAKATVEEDLAALTSYNSNAREAGYKLLALGPTILPNCHKILVNSSHPIQVMQVTDLLAEIGDATSIGPVITMAKRFKHESLIVQSALLTLGLLPQTQKSYEYVVSLLEDRNSNHHVIRSALGYFARQNDERGIPFARRYARPDSHEEIKFAALYVLATLNDNSVKGMIVRQLRKRHTDNRKHILLSGLSNITSIQEFRNSTRFIKQDARYYKSTLRENRFKNLTGKEKLEMAMKMLDEPHMRHERRRSIKYLLDNNRADIIERHLNTREKSTAILFIRNEVLRNKHNLRKENNTFSIVPQ